MKKYIIFPLLFLSTLFMAGCGNKDTTDDNSLVVLNYGKYLIFLLMFLEYVKIFIDILTLIG